MTVKQLALHAIAESLRGLADELETLVAPADKPPADKPPADKPPADKPAADSQALIEESRSVAKTLLTDGDSGGAEARAETLLRTLETRVAVLKQ